MNYTIIQPYHHTNIQADVIIEELKSLADPVNVAGMARFGINSNNTLGISMPVIRTMAKEYRGNHELSLELWDSGIHEARILAALIDDPKNVTQAQMEKWVSEFDSWDVCDQCCMNLFDKTPFAVNKIFEWSEREEEFVKRAAFALIATTAVHNKKLSDDEITEFLPVIIDKSDDERNFVKKAVNWALRQIGKRNMYLNRKAIEAAESILKQNTRSGRWIANDAIRELKDEKIIYRIVKKNEGRGKRSEKF